MVGYPSIDNASVEVLSILGYHNVSVLEQQPDIADDPIVLGNIRPVSLVVRPALCDMLALKPLGGEGENLGVLDKLEEVSFKLGTQVLARIGVVSTSKIRIFGSVSTGISYHILAYSWMEVKKGIVINFSLWYTCHERSG